MKTPYPWHHSLDRKLGFLRMKFRDRLAILFGKKTMFKKVSLFPGGWPALFAKLEFENPINIQLPKFLVLLEDVKKLLVIV